MKLLIAVGEVPSNETPPPPIAALLAAATEIRILSPSQAGPLQWLTGDIDKAQRVANDRLTEMLCRLDAAADVPVSGLRGDELAATALAEALGDFDADHVVLVAARGDSLWRRRRLLDRLLDDYGLSVTIELV